MQSLCAHNLPTRDRGCSLWQRVPLSRVCNLWILHFHQKKPGMLTPFIESFLIIEIAGSFPRLNPTAPYSIAEMGYPSVLEFQHPKTIAPGWPCTSVVNHGRFLNRITMSLECTWHSQRGLVYALLCARTQSQTSH